MLDDAPWTPEDFARLIHFQAVEFCDVWPRVGLDGPPSKEQFAAMVALVQACLAYERSVAALLN